MVPQLFAISLYGVVVTLGGPWADPSSSSGGDLGADQTEVVGVDAWFDGLGRIAFFPAMLLVMADTLNIVIVTSVPVFLPVLSSFCTCSFPFLCVQAPPHECHRRPCCSRSPGPGASKKRPSTRPAALGRLEGRLRTPEYARDEADSTALRVSKLENALANQAATHQTTLAALTAEHDDLRSQIVEVREGKSPPFCHLFQTMLISPHWI